MESILLGLERWLSLILEAEFNSALMKVKRDGCAGVSKEAANVSEVLIISRCIDLRQLQHTSRYIRVLTAED